MFDLYEMEQTGKNHSEEASAEERPYRERHRVELRSQETRYTGENDPGYPDRYGRGVEADLLTGTGSSRRRVVRGNTPGGRRTSLPAPSYFRRPEELTRNTSQTAAGPARTPASSGNSGNRELAADLFAPRRAVSGNASAQSRYRAGRTADTGYSPVQDRYRAGRAAETGYSPAQDRYRAGRTADAGYLPVQDRYRAGRAAETGNTAAQSRYRTGRVADPAQNRSQAPQWSAQVRNDNRPRSGQGSAPALQEWESIGSRRTGAASRGETQNPRSQRYERTPGAFRFPTDLENQPPSGGGVPAWRRPQARPPYRDERDEFAPDEDFYTDYSGMEEHAPEDDEDRQGGRRRRQRLVQRRDRERELRRTWLILGGSALAALLVLFLIIHTVIGLLHKSKPGPADAGTQTASAQEESAEGQAQDSAGTEQNPDAVSAPAAEGADEQAEGAEAPAGPDEAQPTDGQTGTETEAGTETGAAAGAEPQTAEQQPGTETQTASGETPAETPGTPAETHEEGTESVQTSPDAAAQAEAGAGTQVTASDVSGVSYSGQDDWRLILVNPWHHLPENYTVETTTLTNGESVDSRCYQALMDMLEDCRAAGGTPIVCSSYRPHEKQVTLFENQVKPLMAAGMTREEAEKEAGTVVAVPGTSEHELGLAVDICDTNNQLLDTSQADTPTQKWLMAHCYDYGFILRYPEDKVDVTGIIYEPWHYRYVGAEAAARIRDRGICLEEYLTQN